MVADDPESFADLDGHCCDNDTVDFAVGVLKGFLASATLGAVGTPKSTDSPSSLAGQLTGTGLAGAAGAVLEKAGGATAATGLVAEAPSAGTSTVLVVGGAAAIGVGDVVQVGAVANLARISAAGIQNSGTSKETGSYTNTHESGKTYDGKGDRTRSQDSGKKVEKETGDKHTATEWKPSSNDREAFKDESRRLDSHGGPQSPNNHNKIESPGKKYRQQDGSN